MAAGVLGPRVTRHSLAPHAVPKLGHAGTAKLATSSLVGSVPKFYAIGIALALPAFWLVVHTRRLVAPDGDRGRATLWLHGWLASTLLLLGVHNLPLAVPGLLTISYHLHSRRAVGVFILAVAALVAIALFIGSLIFMASGQSFEQFSGMR